MPLNPRRRVSPRDRAGARFVALSLALALALGSCGDGDGDGAASRTPAGTGGPGLQVFPASFDLSSARPVRFQAGVIGADGRQVAGGTVEMRFAHLGQPPDCDADPRPGPAATGRFLAVPGSQVGDAAEGPTLLPASEARGVYVADDVRFDRPGCWQVDVTAELEQAGRVTGTGAFTVRAEPAVPAVGDPAPKTRNLTMDSTGAPRPAIDSRAATGDIPDRELHEWTIARAIAERRPALVVFATPVYCQSRFCGPVTDVVQGIAERHEGDAVFIHVEIWRNFQERVVNRAAADWLLREGDLNEPWLFLIDRDGRIAARWDNLFDAAEVDAELSRVAG